MVFTEHFVAGGMAAAGIKQAERSSSSKNLSQVGKEKYFQSVCFYSNCNEFLCLGSVRHINE